MFHVPSAFLSAASIGVKNFLRKSSVQFLHWHCAEIVSRVPSLHPQRQVSSVPHLGGMSDGAVQPGSGANRDERSRSDRKPSLLALIAVAHFCRRSSIRTII